MKQKANFKLQMHSIEEVKNQVQRFLKKNILNKHLIVVGTYTIGMFLFLRVIYKSSSQFLF